MPYRDPDKQKAAQRRWYKRNQERIAAKRSDARDERNVYVKERRADLARFVSEYKEARCCVDCGQSYPARAMDFHHVRGEKLATIKHLVNHCYSRTVIMEEIAKCDLLCAVHHRLRH